MRINVCVVSKAVAGVGAGVAFFLYLAVGNLARSEEVRLLPEEAAKIIAGSLDEPELTHVIAVRPNGERVILLREGVDYLDLDPGAVPVGFPEDGAAVGRVVVRFGGSVWYEGSDCHIEMQGGSPKLIPNTPECRKEVRQ